jgi:hypothetical protein
MITIETLKKFCGDADDSRKLQEPFSVGLWIYATNGHICIRVPMRGDD